MMLQYTIKIPDRLWTALSEQHVFDKAPARARTAFNAATRISRGTGHTRVITGTSTELNAVLSHLRLLVEKIRDKRLTAKQFSTSLWDLDRHAHQRLIQVKSEKTRT